MAKQGARAEHQPSRCCRPRWRRLPFRKVSDALYANQWLDIIYKNASGHEASYKVMPLGLVQQGPRMYLACQFDGHDNYRCLALHRLVSAKASTLTFERPADFDLQQLDDDLVFREKKKRNIFA